MTVLQEFDPTAGSVEAQAARANAYDKNHNGTPITLNGTPITQGSSSSTQNTATEEDITGNIS